MHAIDQVFRPLDDKDDPYRTEPISLKKLRKGDCSWETCKTVLGWIINTVEMTIELPQHHIQRLGDILASIPLTQKRIGIKKWHKILGELRSMSLALPGARNLFSHMQLALVHKFGQRIALKKEVHNAFNDFRHLFQDIANRPMRIAELVPLLASAVGHHDASGSGAGGVWFVPAHIARQLGYTTDPIVWRIEWPNNIKKQLVTTNNPNGTITNSDLELAGGLLHLQALVQYCDVHEQTVLSKTDNLNALFWQCKGSATTNACPSHILRLFGLHQRFHRYVPRFDYLSGPSNPIADALSCLFHLSNNALLTHLKSLVPQKQHFQMLRLKPSVVSSVILALQRKPCKKESLLVAPKPPKQLGPNGKSSVLAWPLIPYSKPSKTKYLSYKSLDNVFEQESLRPKEIPSALDRLRIPTARWPNVPWSGGRRPSAKQCIIRMLNSWKKKDPPPNHVKPIPIQVIQTIQFVAGNSANPVLQRTADMIVLAFFFLLRPGEYTASPSNTQPFDLRSVQLFLGGRHLDLITSSDAQLRCATFASLTFDMQKNGVRGEVIGLGLSGDPVLCPILTLVRIIILLRRANASPLTPLSSVFIQDLWKPVTPTMISTAIKQAVTLVGPSLGFLASDVSAYCLQAAGANALLNARVDPEIITLIGRFVRLLSKRKEWGSTTPPP